MVTGVVSSQYTDKKSVVGIGRYYVAKFSSLCFLLFHSLLLRGVYYHSSPIPCHWHSLGYYHAKHSSITRLYTTCISLQQSILLFPRVVAANERGLYTHPPIPLPAKRVRHAPSTIQLTHTTPTTTLEHSIS